MLATLVKNLADLAAGSNMISRHAAGLMHGKRIIGTATNSALGTTKTTELFLNKCGTSHLTTTRCRLRRCREKRKYREKAQQYYQ